jgi:hypothetical protein
LVVVQIGAWPEIPPQDGRLVKPRLVTAHYNIYLLAVLSCL